MNEFTFVHAADLHLDSPFTGLSEPGSEVADTLKKATFQAFDNLVDLCIKRTVDFLLIAGDIYNSADRSLRAQLKFRDGLRRLNDAGIRSFVVHGNHDPLDGWASSLRWPEYVRIFGGDSVECFTVKKNGRPCAMIHGISYPRRDIKTNLSQRFKRNDSHLFQIGLLHCNAGSSTGHEPYAPCTLDDLKETGIDYWALGHVHTRKILSPDQPYVVYAGNTQGRHVNETGPRGCFLVKVSDTKRAELEFVPVDTIRWDQREIRIESLNSEEALLTMLEQTISGIQEHAEARPSICKLTLCGRGSLHHTLHRAGYIEDIVTQLRDYGLGLVPFVWLDSINTRTQPEIDIDMRRASEDIVGDCLKLIQEYRDNTKNQETLREYLSDLYNDRRCRQYIKMPEEDELLSMLDAAESLCLDKLLGKGDS